MLVLLNFTQSSTETLRFLHCGTTGNMVPPVARWHRDGNAITTSSNEQTMQGTSTMFVISNSLEMLVKRLSTFCICANNSGLTMRSRLSFTYISPIVSIYMYRKSLNRSMGMYFFSEAFNQCQFKTGIYWRPAFIN